ncbi:ubiquitin carboxyl-terminal hydrolase isozyme L3-like [Pectinophora gossypiella]|uniref:ubiquitin carboxyl-terminal hydrolase isozyme L3-like n=1 Tax=Pectinophora gossypiella TaxID=13191 RepID=UPI00214E68B7|nr:ubiquitin carboxyl-terminal hydrolase isozyme L3-like [Pectinophora gossypiella]
MSIVALPMESNPETMNKYLHKLGVSDTWRMVDVMGLDPDALAWVPRPVLAVVLLFPLSEAYEQHRNQQETDLVKKGEQAPKDVFHLKQVLSNVCGNIALVHSVANNITNIELKSDGLLKKYLDDAKDLDAAAKGVLLENSTAILEAYKEIVRSGSGQGANEEEPVNNHFVTFIHKDGQLFELDGRKSFPINHGPTTPDSLLEDAANICRQFIDREPDNIGFNVVALVQSP